VEGLQEDHAVAALLVYATPLTKACRTPLWWTPLYGGGQFITDADEVSYFAKAFEHASRIALSPGDSLDFIRHLADNWRNSD
jgi:hypothetical protein